MILIREKEQPENRIHSVPGAMRKNRRFVLMRRSRNIAFAPFQEIMNQVWRLLGRSAYQIALPAIRVVIGRSDRAYLMLVADGKILVVKGWLSRQQWQLPGGGIRRGESPAAALTRELKEETNIDIKDSKLTLVDSGRWQTDKLGHNYRIYMTSLPSRPRASRLKPELVEMAWLRPLELRPGSTAKEILAALKSARLV